MAKTIDKLTEKIRDLPDVEKLRILDAILTDLDKPDPEIDRFGRMRHASAGRLTSRARSRPYPTRPLWPSIAARERTLSCSRAAVTRRRGFVVQPTSRRVGTRISR